MKVFQILNSKCHWDATEKFPTAESTTGFFPPSDLFVEAPDYVFEGWGYKDGEFTEPTPPEGLLYDRETNTFYDPNPAPAQEPDPQADTDAMLVDLSYRLALLELGL